MRNHPTDQNKQIQKMKKIFSLIAGCFLMGNAIGQNSLPAGTFASPSEYEIKNLEVLNSDELDYSAVPFGNGVVFTSTRGQTGLFNCNTDFTNGHYSDLYFARKDAEGFYSPPELLEGEVNGRYHDGAATFTTDEATMVFSRNNQRGSNSKGTIDLKIYEGNWKNGAWVNVKELPFNSDEYATCHPSFNRTSSWLYFSSDRPGGYGGMDIYVAERKKDGNWGMPINLGPKVNTSGNEIFPFISPDGILYWSSNGWPGLGGLDIFSMPIENGQETIRTPLQAPINSPHDDFAFTTNLDGTFGYLTSDRPGGLGKDDLYSWKFTGVKPVLAKICVVDKKSGARISDANLTISPAPIQVQGYGTNLGSSPNPEFLQLQAMNMDGKEYLVLVPYDRGLQASANNPSGVSCGLKYPVVPGRTYNVNVEKPGYQPVTRTITAEEILSYDPEWLIPIDVSGPVAMRGKVRDKLDESPIADADVKIINSCTGEELQVQANRLGEFKFPMDCNCDYEIMASKGNYHYDYEMLYSYDMPCEETDGSVLLYLEKDPAPVRRRAPEFEVGKVITLEDVYYDYDKFFIRSDAAEELDKVVQFMRKYPSLELELSSHTDARGSDEYNRRLSQNRAQAAVDYIVSRGIERRRLVAAGYGETQLVNRCANGVRCSDAEHQQNRRTEIKVLRFDEDGVEVRD